MELLRVISADSHMTEPPDLWTTRLDQRFRERAPRVVEDTEKPGHFFRAPGITPFPVAGGFSAGRSGEELKKHLTRGYEAARPGGWDPVERIKDQDIDGVRAEVIYTTLGLALFQLADAALQQACFRVYNDWVAEFRSHDPKRLYPVALISLEDIPTAVKELERAAKLGLSGGMIWGAPPEDRPYYSPVYDPFWTAAQDLDMPLSLHVVTSRDNNTRVVMDRGASGWVNQTAMRFVHLIHEVQKSLTSLIFGGVLARFPGLKIVSAESDIGWLAHYVQRLDHTYEKFGVMVEHPLPLKPSEYVRRQVWATFQDDPIGAANAAVFGEDNCMWASDFPHTDTTWPHSRQVIERDFANVPAHITHKIVYDNAAKLYGIELD